MLCGVSGSIELYRDFPPACGGFLEELHRKGIDQFVGENHRAATARAEGGERGLMPPRQPAKLLFLDFREWWGGFHEMKARPPAEPPWQMPGHGGGEFAFARANLDEIPATGFAHGLRGPYGDGAREGVG